MAKRKRLSKAQREENLARMLEDFAKLSGIDFGEILSSESEEPEREEPGEIEFDVEEPSVETGADFSTEQDFGDDSDDYLDDYFDDIDVDQNEKDSDGETV